jgi:hypothetical protein
MRKVGPSYNRLLKKEEKDKRGTQRRRGYGEPQRKSGREVRHGGLKSYSSASLSSLLRLCVEQFLVFQHPDKR